MEFMESRPTPTKSFKCKCQYPLEESAPAEFPWNLSLYGDEVEVCSRLFGDPGDGTWLCCNGHENKLLHLKGANPFKHLLCGHGECSHVLCESCQLTDILIPVTCMELEAYQDRRPRSAPSNEVPYCHVCRSCGLAHRARFQASFILPVQTVCTCGEDLAMNSLYAIGSVHGYRCDSQNRIMELRMQRIKVLLNRQEAGRSYFS